MRVQCFTVWIVIFFAGLVAGIVFLSAQGAGEWPFILILISLIFFGKNRHHARRL